VCVARLCRSVKIFAQLTIACVILCRECYFSQIASVARFQLARVPKRKLCSPLVLCASALCRVRSDCVCDLCSDASETREVGSPDVTSIQAQCHAFPLSLFSVVRMREGESDCVKSKI
jgi:hypothetical protein